MLRAGASGWSHEDWVGPVYPVHLRDRPEAWLDRYAERFRTVEITSSFDAFPDADLVESWARAGVRLLERGPFEFSLRLPRALSHEAVAAGDADLARDVAGRFDREVLDPLDGEGLLGAVVLGLPSTLPLGPEAVHAIRAVLDALVERRVALDLRHPSWLVGGCVAPTAERLFARRDVCLVESDLTTPDPDVRPPIDARHAYLRFHGRGASDGVGAQDRDDHLYAAADLEPWAARARHLLASGAEVRAYFGNVPGGKAVANATEFMAMCGEPASPRPRLTEQRRLQV